MWNGSSSHQQDLADLGYIPGQIAGQCTPQKINIFPAVEKMGLLETETFLLGGLGGNKLFRGYSLLLTTCNIIYLQ